MTTSSPQVDPSRARLVFVQYGDYAQAAERFEAGLGETYYAQRYSVEAVAELASRFGETYVVGLGGVPRDQRLGSGVRCIQLPETAGHPSAFAGVIERLAELNPTHLVIRAPATPLLKWGAQRVGRVLPLFADSFRPSPRLWWRHRRLASLLNRPAFPCIANHNVNATRDLARIGVRLDKLVPYDWPPEHNPREFSSKAGPIDPAKPKVLFAGSITAAKGVGDLIDAIALLRKRGVNVALTILGDGELDAFQARRDKLGLQSAVTFTGRVPHTDVLEQMRTHDVVVVPSRHEYPEGMPFTIYDTLCVHTPLAASDHPMFRGKVVDGETGVVFRASDPGDLSQRLGALLADRELYAKLSANSADAWAGLQCPVRWHELLEHWLTDTPADREWLRNFGLASGRYD